MKTKVVVITGASSGIGKSCAEHLAGTGHRVYGTSRSASFAGAQADERFSMIPMDVRDEGSVAEMLAFVQEREQRIDVVVNNAGIGLAGAIEDTSVEEARLLFDTNFFGVFRVCRAVLPIMRERGEGLIVNVSSLAGRVTIPFQGFYSASKYAVESLTDALRMELAPFGVQACVIEPGDFRTGFTDSRVLAEASGEDSAYRLRCRTAVGVMERDERGGADPGELARLLARVIECRRPKPRYVSGMASQRLAVGLTRFLPSRWTLKATMATYKV